MSELNAAASQTFVALLDGGDDIWGVCTPDAPGVHGGGATPEQAIADATNALREIEAIRAVEGCAPFKARTLNELKGDPEVAADFERGATAIRVRCD